MIEKLLDAAESGIRLRGYHAVSFRDLANELSIKSSSVHYYFQQKEDLGIALVQRYSHRFFEALKSATKNSNTPYERINAFCNIYRQSLINTDKICLCGVLAAESSGLPVALAKSVRDFMESNIQWVAKSLSNKLSPQERQRKAVHIVATLQGAMMLAGSLHKQKVFDSAARELLATLEEDQHNK